MAKDFVLIKPVIVDLGGPVARITKTPCVGNRWITLSLMAPPDYEHNVPAEAVTVVLNDEILTRFLEALAWPPDDEATK
jgi:hypothetical protein